MKFFLIFVTNGTLFNQFSFDIYIHFEKCLAVTAKLQSTDID